MRRQPKRLNHTTLSVNSREKKEEYSVEFANLAHTFEELERTSSRLTLIELLTRLFRSIERPEEIEQVCYLVQGRVAPFFEALEMGIAEKSVTRSIALASQPLQSILRRSIPRWVIWDWSPGK